MNRSGGDNMTVSVSEEEVRNVLLKQVGKMNKTFVDYENNPFEPETTHQFRVRMRRVRALLNFLKPRMEKEDYKDLNSSLREAAKRLGPLREADVLIEETGEQALEEPDLIDHYQDLFNFLHQERKKLLNYRRSDDVMSYLQDMVDETTEKIQELELTLDDKKEDNWADFIQNRLQKKDRKLKEEYDKADHANYEESHQVRKQAKKVRYAAGGFKKLYAGDDAKVIKKNAKAIQKELGESCDFYVNAGLLREYGEKTDEKELKDSFELLAKRQEEQRQELIEKEL